MDEEKLLHYPHKILLSREVFGWSQPFFSSFSVEVSCAQARVWKYPTDRVFVRSDSAIAVAHDGDQDVLLLGSAALSANYLQTRPFYRASTTPDHFLPAEESLWSSTPRPPTLFTSYLDRYHSSISAISPSSTRFEAIVATVGQPHDTGYVYLVNLSDFSTQSLITPRHRVWCAELLPGETGVSIGGADSHIFLDLATRQELVTTMPSNVFSLKVLSTGSMVFCGLCNGSIVSLDRRQGSQPETHLSMGAGVCSLLLLTNEVYLLGGSMNGSIKLWDRRMFKNEVLSFEGQKSFAMMMGVAVDPTETILISGGQDRAVRIWSFRTGELLQTLRGFPDAVKSIKFHDLDRYAWGAWLGSWSALYYVHGEF